MTPAGGTGSVLRYRATESPERRTEKESVTVSPFTGVQVLELGSPQGN